MTRHGIARLFLGITGSLGVFTWIAFQKLLPNPGAVVVPMAAGIGLFILLRPGRKIGVLALALWLVAIAPAAALLWWICCGDPIHLF